MIKIIILVMLIILPCAAYAVTINYTYDLNGRLTQARYDNGTTITYSYDPAGNLLSREVVTAASTNSSIKLQNILKKANKIYADVRARKTWSKRVQLALVLCSRTMDG